MPDATQADPNGAWGSAVDGIHVTAVRQVGARTGLTVGLDALLEE